MEKNKNIDCFYELWTKKEACLKCEGIGFFKDPAEYDIKKDFLHRNQSIVETEFYSTANTARYALSWAIVEETANANRLNFLF